MTATERAFDSLVHALDGAMVVVTTARGAERDGCLVGFHCQCSIEPRRYAVWLSVANRTCELAAGATHLAMHLLGADDVALAERFGGSTGDELDKLAGLDWTEGPGGVPLIDALPARVVGEIVERHDHPGDHVLFLLGVVDATAPAQGASPLRLAATTHIEPGHEADERR